MSEGQGELDEKAAHFSGVGGGFITLLEMLSNSRTEIIIYKYKYKNTLISMGTVYVLYHYITMLL